MHLEKIFNGNAWWREEWIRTKEYRPQYRTVEWAEYYITLLTWEYCLTKFFNLIPLE